jgi:hypothetical protein
VSHASGPQLTSQSPLPALSSRSASSVAQGGYSNGSSYGAAADTRGPAGPFVAKEVHAKTTAGFLPVAEYRRTYELRIEGHDCPDPMQTFESVGFPPDILDEVSASGDTLVPCSPMQAPCL